MRLHEVLLQVDGDLAQLRLGDAAVLLLGEVDLDAPGVVGELRDARHLLACRPRRVGTTPAGSCHGPRCPSDLLRICPDCVRGCTRRSLRPVRVGSGRWCSGRGDRDATRRAAAAAAQRRGRRASLRWWRRRRRRSTDEGPHDATDVARAARDARRRRARSAAGPGRGRAARRTASPQPAGDRPGEELRRIEAVRRRRRSRLVGAQVTTSTASSASSASTLDHRRRRATAPPPGRRGTSPGPRPPAPRPRRRTPPTTRRRRPAARPAGPRCSRPAHAGAHGIAAPAAAGAHQSGTGRRARADAYDPGYDALCRPLVQGIRGRRPITVSEGTPGRTRQTDEGSP